MLENRNQLNSNYDEQGYFVIRNCFNAAEISSLRKVVLKLISYGKKTTQRSIRRKRSILL